METKRFQGTGLALLLIIGWIVGSAFLGLPAATAAFSQSDLVGTWYFAEVGDNPTTNGPFWAWSTVAVDVTGAVTGGSTVNSGGVPESVTGGNLTIDAVGVVSGSVTVTGGSITTLPHGKLDVSKSVLSLVGTSSGGELGLIVGIKGGGTFATGDLAGTWYFSQFQDRSTNTPMWVSATIAVDATGAVISGSVTDSSDSTFSLTGGSLTIDSAGLVSGSFTVAGGSVTTDHGKLDVNKSTLSLVLTDSVGNVGLIVGTKGNGTFATRDLGGRWFFGEFGDNPTTNGPVWRWGTVWVDATGAITEGSFLTSAGSTVPVTAGSFTIDAAGLLSGSMTLTGESVTLSHGKLGPGKTILSLLVTRSTGSLGIMVGIKEGGAPPFDVNGDGHPDLLWQHETQGSVAVWYLNGATRTDGATIVASQDPAWKVVGTADVNGDGHPDLLWQHETQGSVAVWYLNGATRTDGATIVASQDPAWKVVGPK
jgi:hypothetical protein